MPLDEREQKILEEIERQFYRDDPKLAQTVRRTLGSGSKSRRRVAIAGFVVGMIVMLLFFTTSTWVAILGFIVAVGSAGWLAMNLRAGNGGGRASKAVDDALGRLRRRWRRDG